MAMPLGEERSSRRTVARVLSGSAAETGPAAISNVAPMIRPADARVAIRPCRMGPLLARSIKVGSRRPDSFPGWAGYCGGVWRCHGWEVAVRRGTEARHRRNAVYATDSVDQQLLVVPLEKGGALPGSDRGHEHGAHRRPLVLGRLQCKWHRRPRRLARELQVPPDPAAGRLRVRDHEAADPAVTDHSWVVCAT